MLRSELSGKKSVASECVGAVGQIAPCSQVPTHRPFRPFGAFL